MLRRPGSPVTIRAALSLRAAWRAAPSTVATSGDALVGRRPFAHVRIATSVAEAAQAWSQLQAVARVSPYQRQDWIAAWIDTQASALGMSVAIVIAEDAGGRPIALLPLGVMRRGVVRAAGFLGGRETNYNMGIFDPGSRWTVADVCALLQIAARLMHPRPDLFALAHQPVRWEGIDNPLAALPRSQPSPSFSHHAVLQRDGDAFLRARQSAAARKKLRAKAARLAELGTVAHRIAHTPAEIAAVVAAHVAQKRAKLDAIGVPAPDTARLQELFMRAAMERSGAPAPLELHALFCGETIVAAFGGLAHAGRFSGLLISYAVEPRYARSSPGELLLTAVLKAKCSQGFAQFDLGIGEARYKETYCPLPDPLVDSFVPVTAAGFVWSAADALRLRVKSRIKRSPRAWAGVQRLRKALARVAGR